MKPRLRPLAFTLILILLVFPVAAFAGERIVGEVNVDVLNVRSSPSLTAPVAGRVSIGDQVLIIENLDGWYKIRFGNGERFVKAEYVKLLEPGETQQMAGVVTGSVVNIRESGSYESKIVGKLNKNAQVTINSIEGEWFAITAGGLAGYMHSDYVLITKGAGATAPSSAASEKAQSVLDFAYQYLGVIYRAGGETPAGFDCSGFTKFVFANFGIKLTHSATTQSKEGTPISKSDLLPGDLVFFRTGGSPIGHVGIYVGDGNFIHATVPGDVVKVESLGSNYYTANYVTAARVLK